MTYSVLLTPIGTTIAIIIWQLRPRTTEHKTNPKLMLILMVTLVLKSKIAGFKYPTSTSPPIIIMLTGRAESKLQNTKKRTV
jgi:hypothetical protein